MRSRVAIAVLIVAFAGVAHAESPHRTGWSISLVPRVESFRGGAWNTAALEVPIEGNSSQGRQIVRYDTLDIAAVGIGRGYGGGIALEYAFAPYFALRGTASGLRHSSAAGTVGDAYGAFDAVARLPVGERFDVTAFGRIAKFAVAVDGVDIDRNATGARNWTVEGWLVGGGAGVRWWMTPRVALSGEGSAGITWDTDLVAQDGSGSPKKFRTKRRGSVVAGTLGVEYHW